MDLKEHDIEFILKKIQPKLKFSLLQTDINHGEDWEQDLKEVIIQKIKMEHWCQCPLFRIIYLLLLLFLSCSQAALLLNSKVAKSIDSLLLRLGPTISSLEILFILFPSSST